jgi:DNA adenine methylase
MSEDTGSTGDNLSLVPFLRWPGGKRWLVWGYPDGFPETYNTYIEPFLGSGSVYFHLQPRRAILGDANRELIAAYRAIRHNWKAVENSLKYRARRHRADEDYYYWLRNRLPEALAQRGSRFVYLNRTCFNGIYRVNQFGNFNVPLGAKPRGERAKVIFDTDNFEEIARLLRNAELVASDFEALIDRAKRGDFVFADPPYTIRHNFNGFRKYNEVLFSWADQERLATALIRAARRGVKVLCTNANHESVRGLFKRRGFSVNTVSRTSTISADGATRGSFEELIIRANL